MKGFFILLLVLIIGFIIYAVGRKQEVEAQKEKQAQQQKQQQIQQVQQVQQKQPTKTQQVVKEVGDTVDYAIGGAQIKAGVKAKNKIQQIQQQQNQRHQQEGGLD